MGKDFVKLFSFWYLCLCLHSNSLISTWISIVQFPEFESDPFSLHDRYAYFAEDFEDTASVFGRFSAGVSSVELLRFLIRISSSPRN